MHKESAPWGNNTPDDDPNDGRERSSLLADVDNNGSGRRHAAAVTGGGGLRGAPSPSHRSPPSSSPTTTSGTRWKCALCLAATLVVVYHNVTRSNVELQSIVTRPIKNRIGSRQNSYGSSYEPLVGTTGGMYQDLGGSDSGDDSPLSSRYHEERSGEEANHGARAEDGVPSRPRPRGEVMGRAKNNTRAADPSSSSRAKRSAHPRVACFAGFDDPSSCRDLITRNIRVDEKNWPASIPRRPRGSGKRGGESSSGDVADLYADETEECKLSDPSYQAVPAAPSTCNDVHALGFRFGPSEPPKRRRKSDARSKHLYPSNHMMKYLTSGGYRSVWTLTQLDEEADPRVSIMKTNQLRRGWSSRYLDQNRRDILISERAGNSIEHSNLLPVYQYCAFSSVVPFATAGVLDDYVHDRLERGDVMSAEEQYALAMQAARGLHQAHLYRDGRATHAHADVKPAQFLLFDRPRRSRRGRNATNVLSGMPAMQLNDFNRGNFLTRSVVTNETCPFRMCHVHHKGSLYRSPEEYMECADQSDAIDVYSLGGIFYYVMSDGEKPWYYVGNYKKAVEKILRGERPRLPNAREYEKYGERTMRRVRERSRQPAFVALKKVMTKCWAFEPEDRPSSLQVVRMLEEKWREMNPPAAKGKDR